MGQDLAFDPVLQWSDDGSTICIILRVCCKYKQNVEGHSQFKPPDLYVAFFQIIEQSNLDPGLQIRDLIDNKYAPVTARNDAVMYHMLIGKTKFQIRSFNWINIANKVCYTNIGSSQFLSITFGFMNPADGGIITIGGDHR